VILESVTLAMSAFASPDVHFYATLAASPRACSKMTRNRKLLIGAIVAIPVLALAWWLGSPLFLDTEVNEEFPVAAGAQDETATTETEMVDTTETPDVTTTTADEVATTEAMEETTTTESGGDAMAAGAVALTMGQFEDIDNLHRGSGTATVYELEDGSHVLRLEDFEVTNGPDLHVYLVPASNPTGDDIVDYVELGGLKGNIGNQNYEIPADVDPTGFGSVVIYCQPFHVIFSIANLS
jgi:hypothetical protein